VGDSAANPPIDPSHPRVGPEELIDDRYLLDAFLENTPDHVYFKDHESRFIRISRALATWMGLADPLEAVGRTDFDFFGPDHARKAFADEQRLMRTGEPLVAIEERETWEDGHETWVSTTKVPLRDRNGRIVGVFGISRDITSKKEDEQRLDAQAEQLKQQARDLEELTLVDELTQLHNRRGLTAFGEQALYRARRDGTALTLLFLDLDGLKQINDTFGHAAGDHALQTVARVMREVTRESDLIARIGGDEFCILFSGDTGAAVDAMVERITSGLKAVQTPPFAFELAVSVGALEFDPRTPGSIDDLLAQADRSMYVEKINRAQARQLRAVSDG
jgi:diguanylate cyclase (GGDEF)-like protein/PAS domain S-box-containing protein